MAVSDAHVFHGFLTPVLTQLFFQSHRLPFSHASTEVGGENTPERNFAPTGFRTHEVKFFRSDRKYWLSSFSTFSLNVFRTPFRRGR